MDIYSWILTLAIISGQLIKIPINTESAVSLLDLAVTIFCIKGLLKLKFKLKQPPAYIKGAFIFIFLATVSLTFTPLSLEPLDYLSAFLYTVRFGSYVFLAWLIWSNAFSSLLNNIPKILIISGVGLALLGFFQLIFFPDLRFLTEKGWDPHYFRTVSTFLDPNFTGAFLVLTMLPTISYLRGRNVLTRRVFYIIFALLYIALLTTFSRSSYLMLLVSGITLSYFKKSKVLFLSTLLLFAGLMLGFQIYSQTIAESRNIDREQSATSRLDTWQQGLILFQKSPILGVGFNAYRQGIKEYKLGDETFLASHGSSGNDSSLLFVAATVGIIGLISYLYFLWTFAKPSNKNFILSSATAGLIIHSVFANSLFYPPTLSWLLLTALVPKK